MLSSSSSSGGGLEICISSMPEINRFYEYLRLLILFIGGNHQNCLSGTRANPI